MNYICRQAIKFVFGFRTVDFHTVEKIIALLYDIKHVSIY